MSERLEKKLCYALRHKPEAFNLILDDEGFCSAEDVCKAFNIDMAVLESIVDNSDKKRFEMKDGKIRALYGHSFQRKIAKDEIIPPEYLYHGTSHKAARQIYVEGLKPMKRQYVHLSYDTSIAKEVGKRKDSIPVIMKIDAREAYDAGIKFYSGNERTVLADYIPPEYIQAFVPATSINISNEIFKGIFWIIDKKELENNTLYLFKILTNRNGDVLASYGDLNSKKGDNYNHRLTWETLPKELTHNKSYNYFPRGRVEIRNDIAKIFINPSLNEEAIISYIEKEYNINNKTIGCIKIIIDNSKHYESH